MRTKVLVAALFGALLAGACAAPKGGSLPRARLDSELATAAHNPADELDVELLRQDGALGARIVFGLDGEPEEVLDMLLDFEHADGRRAWSSEHELVRRQGDRATARWHLKGKGGLHPTVLLEFVTEREADGIRLTFGLVERTFGVAELFGDYTIVPDPVRGGSLLAGRVFIASGLPFGPTPDDMTEGMRVDAELAREWMRERLLAR